MSHHPEYQNCAFITEQNCTPYKEAIIGYIGGYIVRATVKDISCEVCGEALLYKKDQTTTALPASFESLIFIKDRGGLITHSGLQMLAKF